MSGPRGVRDPRGSAEARGIGLARLLAGAAAIAVLGYAYALRIAAGDGSPLDYFGYFTNLSSLLAAAIWVASGVLAFRGGRDPGWLATARGVAAACLLLVAAAYNVLIPGTGSAPPWVSAVLHIAFPCFVLLAGALVWALSRLPGVLRRRA